MSFFSDGKILIEIVKIIAPFFMKIRQDISVYKELLEIEDDPAKKIQLKAKIKDLIAQEATRNIKFSYESILKFNERFKAVKLSMNHYKFLSDQDKKSVLITYDINSNVDMIFGKITPQELKKKNLNALVFLLIGGGFWFTPNVMSLTIPKEILLNMNNLIFYVPYLCFLVGAFFAYIFFIKARKLVNYQYLFSQGVIKSLPVI